MGLSGKRLSAVCEGIILTVRFIYRRAINLKHGEGDGPTGRRLARYNRSVSCYHLNSDIFQVRVKLANSYNRANISETLEFDTVELWEVCHYRIPSWVDFLTIVSMI